MLYLTPELTERGTLRLPLADARKMRAKADGKTKSPRGLPPW